MCGTIDIEKALTEGVKAFEPGLLAKANRGILYVDEVRQLGAKEECQRVCGCCQSTVLVWSAVAST